MDPRIPAHEDGAQLPEGLRRELRALRPASGEVEARVDEAVLAAAREHLRAIRRRRRLRLVPRIAAAAAAAGLLGLLWQRDALAPLLRTPARERGASTVEADPAPFEPERFEPERFGTERFGTERFELADLDRSGRVDVVDALVLASIVEGRTPSASRVSDLDGDGVLDDADVEFVVALAVRLDR